MLHVRSIEDYQKIKHTPDKLVVVLFSAAWCGPCKRAELMVNFLLNPDKIIFMKVDVNDLDLLPDTFDITAVPTFKFFKDGKLVYKFSGASQENLENGIKNNI